MIFDSNQVKRDNVQGHGGREIKTFIYVNFSRKPEFPFLDLYFLYVNFDTAIAVEWAFSSRWLLNLKISHFFVCVHKVIACVCMSEAVSQALKTSQITINLIL